jgi:transcriptional regulator with XRE-family HTH domain
MKESGAAWQPFAALGMVTCMGTRQPNRTLRDLRRAHQLTQAALANALCADLARHDVNAAPDARLIAAWESGEIQRPQAHYRESLRRLLGVTSDAALGFTPQQARPTRVISTILDSDSEDAMDRAAFLRGVAAVAFSAAFGQPLQPWLGIEQSRSVRASRIGHDDVAAIERVTIQFDQWDMTRGGGLSVDAAIGQLNWAATLLDQGSFGAPDVRARMCSAVAHLAKVAGWSAYDAGMHAEARRALALGVHAAAEGSDWPLRALLLSDLARQAITLRQPQQALDLLHLARYAADGTATPATRAMLHVVTARAHGWAGNSRECLRQIGVAEDLYEAPTDQNDPVWIRYYVPAQLTGDSGCAAFDAAQHDEALRPEALQRLTTAAEQYGPRWPRSAALCLARSATIQFDATEPEAAVPVGHAFADIATNIASTRLIEDQRTLVLHAAPFTRISDVADLTGRLSTATAGGPSA